MYFLSDTIAEGMKSAKTSRHRKSATRQITKKKSVRKQKKQQKRHHHHSRKRTKTQRHRRQRGGDYNIPTTNTYETTPVSDTAVISIPGKPIVYVKDEKNPQSTEEGLGLSTEDI
jgi:hypothetical protein